MGKPTVGLFGLTGCAGDQLVILNCEDQLLDLVGALDIRDFLMASSANDADCELDLALVEGAVLSKRDEESLKRIRQLEKQPKITGKCTVKFLVCWLIGYVFMVFSRKAIASHRDLRQIIPTAHWTANDHSSKYAGLTSMLISMAH